MTLKEDNILQNALAVMREKLSMTEDLMRVERLDSATGSTDELLPIIRIMDEDYCCLVVPNVTRSSVNRVIQHLQSLAEGSKLPILLITEHLNLPLQKELSSIGMNFADCTGNSHIRHSNRGKSFFCLTQGEKNAARNHRVYPVFHETGIKVLFYLLQDLARIDAPYRQIQQATGVSLSSVKNVIDGLSDKGFAVEHANGRLLRNPRKLLDLWSENYGDVLKPKLLLARMRFRNEACRKRWAEMVLPQGMAWSGEPAAYLLDSYMEPVAFDIYTAVPAAYLMRTGFVQPDDKGEISVYQVFWNQQNLESRIVSPILVYADLMGSGNSRCIETAEKLLEHGIVNFERAVRDANDSGHAPAIGQDL